MIACLISIFWDKHVTFWALPLSAYGANVLALKQTSGHVRAVMHDELVSCFSESALCYLEQCCVQLQVVRTALVDAASVSSLMMTSEAIVVEAPEDKKANGPPAGMGGMGGYGDMY
jgi:hypothetical protein